MDSSRRELIKCAGLCAMAALATGVSASSVSAKTSAQAPAAGDDRAKFASKRFLKHWNCTQAILESLGQKYGADPATAIKMATPFAGGMTTGGTCGAITGAYMILGLAHGKEGAPTPELAQKISSFNEKFKKQFGALECSALMNTDMGTAEGVKAASEKGMFTTLCPKLVEMAVTTAEELA